ncbi:FecR domain-containing protein [Pseudacidovorax sp. RU35E]|uniref:FecR family protein n=1 Tax=Pseudacidovorax sp. RU35E TaxID=1907403 RepID=UPI0009558A6E|nr:FecR domain-containing protein [Pseudacidovorax sp. RU35E]SIR15660.1 FecR family protein [Pseudacidovorax sp. RU35E]
MRQITLPGLFVTAALWAGIVGPAHAQDAVNGGHAGFIKSVQGQVRIVDAAGQSQAAQVGSLLRTTDRIETDAQGAAGFVLRDGTTLVVGPSTHVDIRDYRFDSTTQDGNLLVGLLRGSLRMISGLLGRSHPEAVRVETQTATIGIRGTDFIVSADAP